jgi:hypothetical protein
LVRQYAARVFGTARKPAVPGLDAFIKRESEEMELDVPSGQKVPPQILVLALESKELVFLFALTTTMVRSNSLQAIGLFRISDRI